MMIYIYIYRLCYYYWYIDNLLFKHVSFDTRGDQDMNSPHNKNEIMK